MIAPINNTKTINGTTSNISIRVLEREENTPDNVIEIERGINDFNSLISEIIIIDDAVDIIGNDGYGNIYYIDFENNIFEYYIGSSVHQEIYFF